MAPWQNKAALLNAKQIWNISDTCAARLSLEEMLFWVNMFYNMFTWRGSINVTAPRWLNPHWNSLSHGSWHLSSGAATLKSILLHIKAKVPDLSSSALSDRIHSWYLNKTTPDPCYCHYLPANRQKCKDGATIKAVTFLLFESFHVTTWKFI